MRSGAALSTSNSASFMRAVSAASGATNENGSLVPSVSGTRSTTPPAAVAIVPQPPMAQPRATVGEHRLDVLGGDHELPFAIGRLHRRHGRRRGRCGSRRGRPGGAGGGDGGRASGRRALSHRRLSWRRDQALVQEQDEERQADGEKDATFHG